MVTAKRASHVHIPRDYPTSTICLDESGARATGAKFFVVGGIKVRRPGQLTRTMRALRDHWGHEGELKFSGINRGSQSLYYDLIGRLEETDAHLVGCVVETAVHNPFGRGRPEWLVHADVATQLLVGCINRRELVGLMVDMVTTPPDCSLEDTVRMQVNRRLNATSVVSALSADSKSNDLLQIADLVAGALRFERHRLAGLGGDGGSAKAKVAARLGQTFGSPGMLDGRGDRINLATFRSRGGEQKAALRVVKPTRTSDTRRVSRAAPSA